MKWFAAGFAVAALLAAWMLGYAALDRTAVAQATPTPRTSDTPFWQEPGYEYDPVLAQHQAGQVAAAEAADWVPEIAYLDLGPGLVGHTVDARQLCYQNGHTGLTDYHAQWVWDGRLYEAKGDAMGCIWLPRDVYLEIVFGPDRVHIPISPEYTYSLTLDIAVPELICYCDVVGIEQLPATQGSGVVVWRSEYTRSTP